MRRVLIAFLIGVLALAVSPSAASAHPIEEWTWAVITYREVDAMCGDRHVRARMTDDEWAQQDNIARELKRLVKAWRPRWPINIDFIRRERLTKVSAPGSNGQCWPNRDSVPPAGPYSSHYVLFDHRDANGQWAIGGGIAVICGSCYHGGTYGVGIGVEAALSSLVDIAIHEWLHGVAAWFRSRGVFVCDVHEMGRYGFVNGQQRAFYRAIIASTLPDLNGDGVGDGVSHRALHRGAPN